MNEYKLHILLPKCLDVSEVHLYDCFQKKWKKLWNKAFLRMGAQSNNIKFKQDQFEDEDLLYIITRKDKIIAGATSRIYNLNESNTTYFKNWDELSIQRVRAYTNSIFSCGNFSVFKEDIEDEDLDTKELLLATLFLTSTRLEGIPLIGCTNMNMKINELCLQLGAISIVKNINYQFDNGASEKVEIIMALKSNILENRNSIYLEADRLLKEVFITQDVLHTSIA